MESQCHVLAMCDARSGTPVCQCEAGFYGSGYGHGQDGSSDGCDSQSWQLRTVVNLPQIQCDDDTTFDAANEKLTEAFWKANRMGFADLFFDGGAPEYVGYNMMHDAYPAGATECGDNWAGIQVSIGILFGRYNRTDAVAATTFFASTLSAGPALSAFGQPLNMAVTGTMTANNWAVNTAIVSYGPRISKFVAGTTSDEQQIAPVGFEVTGVSFKIDCMSSGCWVIDLEFTAGEDNFVVFYIPKTGVDTGDENGDFVDELAYDFDYELVPNFAPWNGYGKSIDSTFQPRNFPCSSTMYDSTSATRNRVETCCLGEFVDLYRPVQSFVDAMTGDAVCEDNTLNCADLMTECGGSPVLPSGGTYGADLTVVRPDETASGSKYGIPSFNRFGIFAGMTESKISLNGIIDKRAGNYRAQVQLDNVELRRFAGQLEGTVGVQYTIDTFIGMVDVKPTGGSAGLLDAMASQTAIHLEKTDFFTVTSVHGTNDYSFVFYVNLRLIEVLKEDGDLGENQQTNNEEQRVERTYRTDENNAAHFVQLTFSLGSQYTPMNAGTPQAEIIPLDSVRVGIGGAVGDQATQDSFFHTCLEYETPSNSNVEFSQGIKDTFDSRFSWGASDGGQQCSPEATMCTNPATIEDQFVNFNIPLGIDWLPEEPDYEDVVDKYVYVHLVVTAEDQDAKSSGMALPNDGGDPWQMKTTIFAEIPVVAGGRYKYCDAIVAKTDLKDVVNATLIFGTARNEDEWTRLRVFNDVASTSLQPQEPRFFSSSSIEAGMMTLVLEGAETYFDTGTGQGSDNYGIQLEDVITIHIMEEEEDFEAPGTASKAVLDLLALEGQDNYDPATTPAELRTLGYELNGAFRFRIDRAGQTASLEPTRGLLNVCQFNPPRPSFDDVFPTTCVIRKDVDAKVFMSRDNSFQTAMEVATTADPTDDNEDFIASILGDSTYSSNLGSAYSRMIANKYDINGRYKRAYWINPGYEWTPTQVGGRQIFVVSQKLFVFMLITLDEEWSGGRRTVARKLLTRRSSRRAGSTETEDASALASQSTASFPSNKKTVLGATFGQPEQHVTTWNTKLALTRGQACNQDRAAVKKELTKQLQTAFANSASNVAHVQVAALEITMGSENCFRVSRDGTRRAGEEEELSVATAQAQSLVVFDADEAKINPVLLKQQPGMITATPVGLPSNYELDETYQPSQDVEEESSTDMMPIIAGAAGGAGGCLILSGLAYWFMKRRGRSDDAEGPYELAATRNSLKEAAHNSGIGDLRSSLQGVEGLEGVDLTGIGDARDAGFSDGKRLSTVQINDLKSALADELGK